MIHKLSFILVLLSLVVACGGDDGSEGGGPPGSTTITVAGAVDVTGSAVVKGTFTRTGFSTQADCETLASEGYEGGTFLLPAPFFGEPLLPSGGIYNSTVRIEAEDYQGPGTYVNDGEVTQIFGKIIIGNFANSPEYFPEDGIATVTVNPDGSGKLEFDDIPEVVAGVLHISGTHNWTCTDPPPPPAEE